MAIAQYKDMYAPLGKGDILIVDDLCDNIDILRRHLFRHDFNIHFARNGDMALEHIAKQCPDLVLLDWMMPGMSGLEVLREIRKKYSPSHLPVVMVTAINEVNCVIQAFDHGANDYIVKPFDSKVVLARVKNQIERLQAIRTLEDLMLKSNGVASFRDATALDHEDVVRDAIAARKSAEESLRAALERAEAASRAKKAFLSNMSHELRTPLNAVIGLSSILSDELDDGQKELVEQINKSGEHLLSILNSLLRMSELEQNHPALRRGAVAANSLVQDAIDVLCFTAKEGDIDLCFETCADDEELFADKVALKQALINVISNAIKFSPAGEKVCVKIEKLTVDRLAFIVVDSGIGISEEKLGRMGEPFERGDFDYEGCYDGVGLGLAIARRLVEAHGGEIKFERRASKGAKVTIIMPQNNLNYVNKTK